MSLRMLVCLDRSPFADSAGRLALSLLEQVDGCELTALHVVNVVASSGSLLKDLPGHLGFEPSIVTAEEGEAADESGRAVLGRLKVAAQQRGLEVTTVLEHGAVIERICHWGERFDLVILGLRGETEARFPGSGGGNVHNVLTKISAPALLTPAGVDEITAIAVGYDGSVSAEHALAAVRPLVEAFGFPVHAIYVGDADKGRQVLDNVDFGIGDVTVQTHVVQGDSVHRALATQAQAAGANVLALGFRGSNPLKDFVFGSAAEYIMRNTSLIVLVSQ